MADVAKKITEDEAKVYDRQIRLWGLDAQKRLRGARVLVVGMGGLGAEVAKNIVLVGVEAVHLMDHQETTEDDLKSQFFLRKSHLKSNRAESSLPLVQLLNPMVKVTAETCTITSKPPEFLKDYHVVIYLDSDWQTAIQIDQSCREYGTKLFIGSAFGLYGYIFSDLGRHEFAVDVVEKKATHGHEHIGEPRAKKLKVEESHKTVKQVIDFLPLERVLTPDWLKADHSASRKIPDGFFFAKLISDFIHHNKRLPLDLDDDRESLATGLLRVTTEMAVSQERIPSEMLDECYKTQSSVCAVVGALLSQEVIKVLSLKDRPHDNFIFFDARHGTAYVDKIGR